MDTLKLINEKPSAFAQILNQNQEKITRKAYEKCLKKITDLTTTDEQLIDEDVTPTVSMDDSVQETESFWEDSSSIVPMLEDNDQQQGDKAQDKII